MRVTIEMIAREAEVSAPTVSRALNNDRLVHPATRARVIAIATKIGYQRSTRRKKDRSDTKTPRITFLVSHLSHYPINHGLLSLIHGITAEADATTCQLFIEHLNESSRGKLHLRTHRPRSLLPDTTDIVVIQGKHDPHDVDTLARLVPVVSLQWEYAGTQVDLVESFNARGIADIVRMLVSKGHRRLCWIQDRYVSSFFSDRLAGFYRGCIETGLKAAEMPVVPITELVASDATFLNILGNLRTEGVTALICANDGLAHEIAALCHKHGVRIPQDISLTGYDADPQQTSDGLEMCSYHPNFVDLGRVALRVCLQRLSEPASKPIIQSMEGHIREGQTVASLQPLH